MTLLVRGALRLPRKSRQRRHLLYLLVAGAGSGALSACMVGPRYSPPGVGTPPRVTSAALAARATGDAAVPAAWWRAFDDPMLDQVERLALAGNLDLKTAAARVARARAGLRIAGSAGLPKAGAAASYMRERASSNGIMSLTGASQVAPSAASGADPFGTTTLDTGSGNADFDLFQAGFDASWEIDLWGKARRLREAAKAGAQSAVFERDAMRISLTAEVARTYFEMRGAQVRLAIVRSNSDTAARGYAIALRREQAGTASRYDAATAGTQIANIDASIPAMERQVEDARNALAFLAGLEPHALDTLLDMGQSANLPSVPGQLDLGIAADIIRHRPDIAGAEADLHAATARVGAATADFYPSLSLAGSAGTQALDLANVPQWASRQFIVGPVLNLPLFQGGRLKGQLQLTKADEQAAAIHYRETVLRAWHEVDDALTLLRTEQARTNAAERAVEQSRTGMKVAARRYGAGATGYIDVLIAQRAQLASEAERASALTDRMIAVIALYKSVGGGWVPPGGAIPQGAGH